MARETDMAVEEKKKSASHKRLLYVIGGVFALSIAVGVLIEDRPRRHTPYDTDVKETVLVTTESASLRGGPGTDFDVIGTAKSGDILPVLERKDEWIIVPAEGDTVAGSVSRYEWLKVLAKGDTVWISEGLTTKAVRDVLSNGETMWFISSTS